MDAHLAFRIKVLPHSKKSELPMTYIICHVGHCICKNYLPLQHHGGPFTNDITLFAQGKNISLSPSVLLLVPLVYCKFLKIQLSPLIILNVAKERSISTLCTK